MILELNLKCQLKVKQSFKHAIPPFLTLLAWKNGILDKKKLEREQWMYMSIQDTVVSAKEWPLALHTQIILENFTDENPSDPNMSLQTLGAVRIQLFQELPIQKMGLWKYCNNWTDIKLWVLMKSRLAS